MAKSRNYSQTASVSQKDWEALRRSGISVDKMRAEIDAHWLRSMTESAYMELPAQSRSVKLPSDERSRATDDAVN